MLAEGNLFLFRVATWIWNHKVSRHSSLDEAARCDSKPAGKSGNRTGCRHTTHNFSLKTAPWCRMRLTMFMCHINRPDVAKKSVRRELGSCWIKSWTQGTTSVFPLTAATPNSWSNSAWEGKEIYPGHHELICHLSSMFPSSLYRHSDLLIINSDRVTEFTALFSRRRQKCCSSCIEHSEKQSKLLLH